MEDLEKVVGEPEKETQTPPLEPPKEETQKEVQVEIKPEDEDILKKAEQLDNLNKAIQEAETQLREKRKKPKIEEDELPKIDMEDPSSKAWDKHIKSEVAPIQLEMEQAKSERRVFALRQFLQDRPSLAANTNKIKKLMDTYEKIKSSSELTTEGILTDIGRAYYADNHQEIFATEDNREFERAKAESIASDIGVSKGATSYTPQREAVIPLSEEDKAILQKWNMTPAEWQTLKKKQK